MSKALILLTFFTLFTTLFAFNDSCFQYPTNATCSKYVNYTVNIESIRHSDLTSYQQIAPLLKGVSPTCFDLYSRYVCQEKYPSCKSDTRLCPSDCQRLYSTCEPFFQLIGNTSLLPNCQTFPNTSLCDSKVSLNESQHEPLNLLAAPPGFTIQNCPAPFLKDRIDGETYDELYCAFGCCIPCPVQNVVYKKGWAEKGFLVCNILRFISAILSFILLVSYLILPEKRRHPSLLILNLSISIFLFSMTSFFSIGDPRRLQCASNGISPGEMGNNALCAAQGAILVFGSFATTVWCSALILNLHVHTVWNSYYFADKYLIVHLVCWGIPTVITCIALGLHAIKFEIASLCLVSMEYIFRLFFYPLAAIIIPSFLIHIATFFYIAKVAIQENLQSDPSATTISANGVVIGAQVSHRHLVAAVKIQWRALMLAIAAIVTVLFYWLAYMTQMNQINKLKFTEGFTSIWLQCMLRYDQDTCYEQIKSSLPSFPLMLSADLLAGLIGFWLFILFAKRSLWQEWSDFFYDFRTRDKGYPEFLTL